MRLSYSKITMQPTQAISNFLAARLKQCGASFNNLFYLAGDMQTKIMLMRGSGDGSFS